jgi:hypothetical protein
MMSLGVIAIVFLAVLMAVLMFVGVSKLSEE